MEYTATTKGAVGASRGRNDGLGRVMKGIVRQLVVHLALLSCAVFLVGCGSPGSDGGGTAEGPRAGTTRTTRAPEPSVNAPSYPMPFLGEASPERFRQIRLLVRAAEEAMPRSSEPGQLEFGFIEAGVASMVAGDPVKVSEQDLQLGMARCQGAMDDYDHFPTMASALSVVPLGVARTADGIQLTVFALGVHLMANRPPTTVPEASDPITIAGFERDTRRAVLVEGPIPMKADSPDADSTRAQ